MEERAQVAGCPSEEVRALMDRGSHGPVVITQAETMVNPSTERYADVRVCFHGRVAVSWCSNDEHTFDARTGLCIESSDGRMKGWRIAPWEMYRFDAVDAQKYLADQKASGTDSKTALPKDRLREAVEDLRDLQRRFPLGEKLAVEIVHEDPVQEQVTKQDVQPVRSVLFIATCYPAGSFALDAIDVVHKVMHAIALERGIITAHDQCEYVSMGGVLVGKRFDAVISTDDWMESIIPRGGDEKRWWYSQVLSRRKLGAVLHFLSTTDVRQRPVPTASLTQPQ